jgi:hypothetical protein
MPIPRAEAPVVDVSGEDEGRPASRPARKTEDSRPEERSGRTRDRGRRGAARDKAPVEADEVETPEVVEAVEAPDDVMVHARREDRPRDDRNRGTDRRSDRRDTRRDDRAVVGMGDHMPDFLLRSFALPASD